MYGEIKSWSAAGAYTCRMIRAVAKVQVQLGPSFSDVIGDFTADNVTYQVWWTTASSFIQPQSTPNSVYLETSGSSMTSDVGYLLQKAGATERQTNVFVHEFQSSIYGRSRVAIGKDIFAPHRMNILLEKGSGANSKWYRLEFYNHNNSEYLDVLRNHHYLFTINSVRSEGYDRHSYAQGHPGGNLEYTITINDNSQSITSNGQYAVVTSVDTAWISGDVTDQAVAKFRYIYPPEMTAAPIDFAGMRKADTIVIESGSIRPGSATLAITSPSGTNWETNPIIKPTNQDLKITTGNGLEEAVIIIKCGNIYHRLPIRRRP
jgi:hypothetical protein